MSHNISANNKRIAKNTMMLYFRTFITMIVGLYTSRIILDVIGVEDYGIYNVVGGVVGLFSIISASLTSAISRFLTFELGKNDVEKLKTVFRTSVTIQIGMAILSAIIMEVIGVWFVNSKLNIPTERLEAANWVFQCSVFTFMVNVVSVPYNAAIIAHEKMSAFAYISILDTTLKLVIVYLLYLTLSDKLIMYAILLAMTASLIRLIYSLYCKKNFAECTYKFTWDRSLIYEISSFASWNFIGSSAAILRDQGINISINIFYGTAVNAARGIAEQVKYAINNFTDSFMTALKPQIMKSYANGDREHMMNLIFLGSKFSFFLMLLLTLPVMIEAPLILSVWLKDVPQHTVNFVRLSLFYSLFESLSPTLLTGQHATGNIKWYQIIVGGIQFVNLPVAFMCLWLGCPPESTVVICIITGQLCLGARLIMTRHSIGLSIRNFINDVYIKVTLVTFTSSILPLALYFSLPESIFSFFVICFSSIICTTISVMLYGVTRQERNLLIHKLYSRLRKY